MIHEQISRQDESRMELNAVMCLFWDLEASASALYQQMAARETCPVRAEGWRRLENWRLLLGESRANHAVYVSRQLLMTSREALRTGQVNSGVENDLFGLMTRIMHLKFLQVMLIASLRQQASVVSMIDVDKFGTSVAFVTRLVLSSRGH